VAASARDSTTPIPDSRFPIPDYGTLPGDGSAAMKSFALFLVRKRIARPSGSVATERRLMARKSTDQLLIKRACCASIEA
jgi:hypothetical protein